jgi:hypothetical protein
MFKNLTSLKKKISGAKISIKSDKCFLKFTEKILKFTENDSQIHRKYKNSLSKIKKGGEKTPP